MAERPCILLVDDDPGVREILHVILESEGYNTATATNGVEALEQAATHDLDLVLLDLQMPVMGGQQTLACLREREITVPVVFMSAALRVSDEASRCGADGYLSKPFLVEDVIAVAARFCGV